MRMDEGTEAGLDGRMHGERGASRGFVAHRSAVLLALAAGLGLRLFFILHYAYVSGDSLVYGDIARNLIEHHVYGLSTTLDGLQAAPRPTLIRLPGYPLFLALCFRIFGMDRYQPVMFVQAAIDLGSCWLMAGLASRMFNRRTGLVALWLGVLCPFTANYVAAPLTETLTLFCIALSFYSLARWRAGILQRETDGADRWLALLACALAFAILLRPEQGLLAAAIVPAVLWISLREGPKRNGARALIPGLLLALGTLLPLAPWTARNWRTFHVLQPLAPRSAMDPGETNPAGFQRWYRTWGIDFASTDAVYWAYDGHPISAADLPRRAFDSKEQQAATETLLADYNEDQTPTAALDLRFNALAETRIRAHAFEYYVGLPAARLLNMALRPRTEMLPVPTEWWKSGGHAKTAMFAAGYALLNLMYFCLAGLSLRRRSMWRMHQPLIWSMVTMMLLRAALLLTLDNSEPRYTLEFFPVLFVLGAATLARWRRSSEMEHSR